MKHQTLKRSLFLSSFIFFLLAWSSSSASAGCLPEMFCPDYYDPVCGTDGLTYSNGCMARNACVAIKHKGICPLPPPRCPDQDQDGYSPIGGQCGPIDCNDRDSWINPGMACLDIFDPVCGVDGKTYSNSCEALKHCVQIKHEGECAQSPTCPDGGMLCPQIFDPVCGMDGKTYSSACAAGQHCVQIKHEGECAQPPACPDADEDGYSPRGEACGPVDCNDQDPTINPGMACPEIFAPVCGMDGKTYSSACAAGQHCVQIKHEGECAQPPACPDADEDGYSPKGEACGPIDCNDQDPKINPGMLCPQIFAPVCGMDGKTYPSACAAGQHCVQIKHEGECLWQGFSTPYTNEP
jgi:coxsackievirus/adenovirus receptor